MKTAASTEPASGQTRERHFVLGTAGHIDHGKTSLIRALTGTDTDRLPEEKSRGMTIELGFAELSLGDLRFGVVDVPGHERFVRTMVAGATGIDIALIVVAADDSVMPQTIEHVEILHLLGVRHAVVAVTKIDTVEPDMVELVIEDVRGLLAGTPLQGAEIRPVSSITRDGLEEFKSAIERVALRLGSAVAVNPFRMCVDRVFTMPGRGTVVTGSVLRGEVVSGDTLDIWPGRTACRVRDLHNHGREQDCLNTGQRAAINLGGISKEDVVRGCELATPGYLAASHMIDVKLRCLKSQARPLKSTSKVRLCTGTVELPSRVVLLDRPALEPGDSTFAQLRCPEPLTTTYGQHFIIRDESATRTIGGGTVLRPTAKRRRRSIEEASTALGVLESGAPIDRVEQVLRTAGFVKPTDLRVCAQAGVELADIPAIYDRLKNEQRLITIPGIELDVVPAAVDDLADRLTGRLARHHQQHPDTPGWHADSVLGWLDRQVGRALVRPLFDRWVDEGRLKRLGKFVCLPQFAPSLSGADEKLLVSLTQEIKRGRFQPPGLEALEASKKADRKRIEKLATLAVALGELVKVDAKIYLHAEMDQELRTTLSDLIEKTGGAAVSEVREALDSSRKFVVPFLEYLDRTGFTKRMGDRRVLAGGDT